MERLDAFFELHKRIADLDDRILTLSCRIKSPKAQTISDMPRGTASNENQLERYIVAKERLEEQKKQLEEELDRMWKELKAELVQCGVGFEERALMYLRFRRGMPWKKCTIKMRTKYNPEWNENKTFRVYRSIVKSIQENCANSV